MNTAVIVGVGPGLSASLARRFARAQHAVGLISRSDEHLKPVAKEVEALGMRAARATGDVTMPDSLDNALKAIARELGDPTTLIYNAGAFAMGGVLELEPSEMERVWRGNCLGALVAARAVLPAMLAKGGGTLLFTGATASLRGAARFGAFASGKFAMRALAQSIAREMGPKGVHVAHVVVDGRIGPAGTKDPAMLDPDAIAEVYYGLYAQHPSSWTLELDVRPSVEKF